MSLGAGEGQGACIVAHTVGGDGAGDGHVLVGFLVRVSVHDRQFKRRLAGFAAAAHFHRGDFVEICQIVSRLDPQA